MGKKKDKKRGEQVAADFTEHAMKQIAEQFQKQGLDVQLKVTSFDPVTGKVETKDLTPEQVYRPIPPMPPPISRGDVLPWAIWQRMMNQMNYPGWSPCRFANRCGANGDGAAFVYGVTRDRIGMWTQPFPVCHLRTDANDAKAAAGFDFPEEVIMPGLTYLASGMTIALFESVDTAARAAELMLPLLPPANLDIDEAKLKEIHSMLEFHGIRRSEDMHAHQRADGPELAIWTSVGADAEKPKVLS